MFTLIGWPGVLQNLHALEVLDLNSHNYWTQAISWWQNPDSKTGIRPNIFHKFATTILSRWGKTVKQLPEYGVLQSGKAIKQENALKFQGFLTCSVLESDLVIYPFSIVRVEWGEST